MKSLLRITALALVATIVGFFSTNRASAAAMEAAKAVDAVVKEVSGSAMATPGGPLRVGMKLPAGTVITTGKDSHVTLDLGDSGVIRLKEDTTMSIEQLTVRGSGNNAVVETKLDVTKGSILGNVKKLSSASKYEVKTTRGVAGIRGTSFAIFAIGIFQCADGSLVVALINLTTGQTETFVVPAGQQVDGTSNTPTPVAMAVAILTNLRTEAQVVGGFGTDSGIILVVAGDPNAIRDAIAKAVGEASDGTARDPVRPEDEEMTDHCSSGSYYTVSSGLGGRGFRRGSRGAN